MNKLARAFNNKLDDFVKSLETLCVAFPDVLYLVIMFQNAIYMSKIADEKIPVCFYFKYVVRPYEIELLKCNERFFLSHSFDELCTQQSMSSGIVDTLKSIWIKLKQENKDVIFAHLNLLMALSKAHATSIAGSP